MKNVKRFVTATAVVGLVAAGLTTLATPARAIYCVPAAVPAGYYPTGVPCRFGWHGE